MIHAIFAVISIVFISSVIVGLIINCIVDGLDSDFKHFNDYGDRPTAKITFDEFLLFYECNKRNLSCKTTYIIFDDCKKRICLQFETRKEYKKYIKWLKVQQNLEKIKEENSNREYIIQSTLEKAQALKAKVEKEKEKANQEVQSVINFQKDLFDYANKKK